MFCEIKDNILTIKRWYIALFKRLLKRTEFIVMLLTLPLLVIGIMSVSKQKKGLLDIGIVASSSCNSDVREVVNEESLILYGCFRIHLMISEIIV